MKASLVLRAAEVTLCLLRAAIVILVLSLLAQPLAAQRWQ